MTDIPEEEKQSIHLPDGLVEGKQNYKSHGCEHDFILMSEPDYSDIGWRCKKCHRKQTKIESMK